MRSSEGKTVCKPGSVNSLHCRDSHSSGSSVTGRLKQPTRKLLRAAACASLFGLAPAGVCPATAVTDSAVRSYRTISPLPIYRRYIFCGTFRRLTPPRRYLATCPVEPGLSSISPKSDIAVAWPTPVSRILRLKPKTKAFLPAKKNQPVRHVTLRIL